MQAAGSSGTPIARRVRALRTRLSARFVHRSSPDLRSRSASAVAVLGFAAAGLLFATSAETAHGTQLRADRTDLVGLIRSENTKHDDLARRVAGLAAEVDARTSAEAGVDADVAALRSAAGQVGFWAGTAPVTGRGVTVTLDDAPSGGTRPADAQPDDLVVHQQDVQAVVNALWSGGARALMLMDQRVIATSAVRCVGNTLILQGRVYSPPYRVAALGDPARLHAALDASPTLSIYREYVQRDGLGWRTQDQDGMIFPGYDGPLRLRYATVAPVASAASGSDAPRSPVPARRS